MSGGSSSGGMQQQLPAQMQPVPQAELRTSGYGNMGYQQVPQTFTPQGMPDWMQAGNMGVGAVPGQTQNWMAAPWWGTNAATGEALTQADLQPQAQAPMQQAQQQQAAPAQAQMPSAPGKGLQQRTGSWNDDGGWVSNPADTQFDIGRYPAGRMYREAGGKL